MRSFPILLGGSAFLALAAPLFAQDSVSNAGTSLPGDALDVYTAAQNHTQKNYVVDLAPLRTSWGTTFRVGPLVKAGKSSSAFSNSLISAQALSATLLKGVPYRAASYSRWGTAGQGIHPTRNNAPSGSVSPLGLSNQFAVAFAEFGTTDLSRNYNGIIGAFVNYAPADVTRLYVQRMSAATNGLNNNEDRSQLGMGGVDSSGNISFRADGVGATGPAIITGNNVLRALLGSRTAGVANKVDNVGITQGNWLVVGSGTTHNTPTVIPADLVGRPLTIGSNFATQYIYESAALVISNTTTHRTGSTDHRGAVNWSKQQLFGGSIGTGVMMGKDAANKTRALLVWGTSATGSVTANAVATVPAAVTDPLNGNVIDFSGEGQHHNSQTAFRGGNGQVAFGADNNGDYLAATVMETVAGGGAANPFNGLVVAKLDSAANVLGWSTAAYVDAFGNKKPILDGSHAVIGECTELFNVTGGTPTGPSMSAPCLDSVGNLWFLSAVELFTAGPRGTPGNDFDSALLRAVYDRASFGWNLELVLQLGQVIHGRNSDRSYQIRFMGIADSNSVSSGTMFSGNILQCAMNDVDPTLLKEQDPRTLGGIVVNAEIVYDVDEDNVFDDSLGVDESYNVVLFVGPERQKAKPAAAPGRTVTRQL